MKPLGPLWLRIAYFVVAMAVLWSFVKPLNSPGGTALYFILGALVIVAMILQSRSRGR